MRMLTNVANCRARVSPETQYCRPLAGMDCRLNKETSDRRAHDAHQSGIPPRREVRSRVPLLEVITGVSATLDLVSPPLVNHHKTVAYIASEIAAQLGVPGPDRADITWAALLHDIGAFSVQFRSAAMEFELHDAGTHEETGYRLLKTYRHFAGAADLVRCHHTFWNRGRGKWRSGREVPMGSHIVHLADRIAALWVNDYWSPARIPVIVGKIRAQSGQMFVPEHVEAFLGLASDKAWWAELTAADGLTALQSSVRDVSVGRNVAELRELASFLCRLIDFRSRFTATHSAGVAAVAAALAQWHAFSPNRCEAIRVAGYLHDLGKLAINLEIIEKPGRLDRNEMQLMETHALHTFSALDAIPELDAVKNWASQHHERLDGSGYPFGLSHKELPVESRIVAVADVFTAMLEQRPYRNAMAAGEARGILQGMATRRLLDGDVVDILTTNFTELDDLLKREQGRALQEYQRLRQGQPAC
jgi:putative nucleotidyltransferase with HDIG domain